MKIIFAGTPDFAVPVLTALQHAGHEIALVLTQPDRPAGRGRKLAPSPIKEYALAHKLPVAQPTSLKKPEVIASIQAIQADLMIVIAYGLIVPDAVLTAPTHGCICVHLSLLPRWRGAAPAQRALLAGDQITGVTLFQMDAGIDTGKVLAYATLNIDKHDTTGSLYTRLGQLGAQAIQKYLPDILQGKIVPQAQDDDSMTYAVKIDKQDAEINWELSAQQIERMIRAFNPWPVAYTTLNNERLRLWQATAISQLSDAPIGMILDAHKNGIDVATGVGILQIKQLQWPGGKIQMAGQALNANNNPLMTGVTLGQHE